MLGVGGGVVLAQFLTPSQFGLFAIAAFAVSAMTLFSELGFGAAFIRKPTEVSREELESLFTFQIVFVSLLTVTLFIAAPFIGDIYRSPDVTLLVQALSISLLLVSLRSVPTIVSERRLMYGPIAFADVSGQFAYWLVAISGVVGGLGVWSLVLATLASATTSTVMLYARTGWQPRLRFNWQPIWASARFGVMYQSQSIASFLKDTLIPAFGGIVYGGAAVGYLSWAHQLAAAPLMLTHLVSRVGYSALARLQNDREAFTAMVRSMLKWTCQLTFPAFALLVGLAPEIIIYIYGSKWLPALPAFYVLCANMILGVGTGVLMSALYSLGRGVAGLRISIGWMALTWLLALGMTAGGADFTSLAAAYAISTAGALALLVFELRDLQVLGILAAVLTPIASGVLFAVALHLSAPLLVRNVWSLLAVILISGMGGLAVNLWPDRAHLVRVARSKLLRTEDAANATDRLL